MTSRELLALAVVAAPFLTVAVVVVAPRRAVATVARGGAFASAAAAVALAAVALGSPQHPLVERWVVVDAAAGLLVGVIGVVGLASVLVSPAYLTVPATTGLVRPEWRTRTFYALLFAFWAILAAIPLIGNLGGAWLLVEATTAASALLVGFGGKPRALEAAWKYLILTSLGLGIALLGIVILAAGSVHGGLDALSWRELGNVRSGHGSTLVAYLLLLAGLASKIGWAPVHNWLPDAHSEAPAPVSALLSAALLPAVLLVAWRSSQALSPVIGPSTARSVLIGFGLLSLAVAVPFLWQPMAWKRLLAYSSLEHMGVIALGIGFGTPLALAGVAVHVVGHALAKALGFYAATPLIGHEPRAAGHPADGIGRTRTSLGVVLGISLGALAGVPPSPLFASEVLIVAGGFAAGRPWSAGAAAALLALGSLGLAQALIETTTGAGRTRDRETAPGLRGVALLTCVAVPCLLGLTAAALWLPGSAIAHALVRGIR
ncbi:MAG TPA: proton-conducting transporter membrane subunit [Gaiellaceae bacterium]